MDDGGAPHPEWCNSRERGKKQYGEGGISLPDHAPKRAGSLGRSAGPPSRRAPLPAVAASSRQRVQALRPAEVLGPADPIEASQWSGRHQKTQQCLPHASVARLWCVQGADLTGLSGLTGFAVSFGKRGRSRRPSGIRESFLTQCATIERKSLDQVPGMSRGCSEQLPRHFVLSILRAKSRSGSNEYADCNRSKNTFVHPGMNPREVIDERGNCCSGILRSPRLFRARSTGTPAISGTIP